MKRLKNSWVRPLLWLLPAGGILLAGMTEAAAQRAVDPPRAGAKRPAASSPSQPAQAAREVVFVKRGDVALRSGPERNDPIVTTVRQGEELSVLGREGVRLQVRTAVGETGYIASLNVTDVPPRSPSGRQVVLRDDVGPSERTSVTAIRGLHPLAEEYADAEGIPEEAVEDVKKMEEYGKSITRAELDSFAAEGDIVQP